MGEDSNTVVTLKVRVTPEFREKIINSAKKHNRSMNAEIVHRLEESYIFSNEHIPPETQKNMLDFFDIVEKNIQLQDELIKKNQALTEELVKSKKAP